jgi:hypothetical protein
VLAKYEPFMTVYLLGERATVTPVQPTADTDELLDLHCHNKGCSYILENKFDYFCVAVYRRVQIHMTKLICPTPMQLTENEMNRHTKR